MDPAVIRRARAGAPEALGLLYDAYAERLWRAAYHLLGSREDAEDVLHDVFLGLPELLRRYDERGQFEGWLHRVTTRVALSRLRRRTRRPEVELDAIAVPAECPDGEHLGERELLAAAIAALPDALRVVFVLRVVEGYSHAEIAALLGIRRGTSEVRLCRALKQLRIRLEAAR